MRDQLFDVENFFCHIFLMCSYDLRSGTDFGTPYCPGSVMVTAMVSVRSWRRVKMHLTYYWIVCLSSRSAYPLTQMQLFTLVKYIRRLKQ